MKLKLKRLSDVLEIQNGYAFDSDLFDSKEGTPLIRIRDLKGGERTVARFRGDYDPKYLVTAGDMLIGMDGEFRCYKWKGEDALLNQRVCKLHSFSAEIEPDFVFFALNERLREIEDATPYSTVKHLSSKKVSNIEISFPPISEQRRVVARIQECLSRVEEMERLQAEVTADATSIPRRFLDQEFAEIATDSPSVLIDDVTTDSRYGTNQKCSENAVGTPILRIPNVAKGYVNKENLKYCSLDKNELEKVGLQSGDLLVVRTNGSPDLVGRCAVFRETSQFGFASYLIRFRLDQTRVLPEYVSFFLQSPTGRNAMAGIRKTSAGQYNVNSENLRGISLPLPDLNTQERLINRASQIQVMSSEMAEDRSSQTAALRNAILRQAFAGEL